MEILNFNREGNLIIQQDEGIKKSAYFIPDNPGVYEDHAGEKVMLNIEFEQGTIIGEAVFEEDRFHFIGAVEVVNNN